jgi:signal recognition particle GTPase
MLFGVGEGADDLQPFAADEFAKALAGVDSEMDQRSAKD